MGRRLATNVESGRIAGEIALRMEAVPPYGPKVVVSGKAPAEIGVSVSHLELIWAFVFCWMVFYEGGVNKGLSNSDGSMEPAQERVFDRAGKLWLWARGLRHGYARWPDGLPSPQTYESEIEEYYGLKANLVFQKAVAFMLCHEWAHVALGHLISKQAGLASSEQVKEMEKDADRAALDALLDQAKDDNEKSAEVWAALSATLSTFFLFKSPVDALVPRAHIPLHHRVAHLVDAVSLRDEGYHTISDSSPVWCFRMCSQTCLLRTASLMTGRIHGTMRWIDSTRRLHHDDVSSLRRLGRRHLDLKALAI